MTRSLPTLASTGSCARFRPACSHQIRAGPSCDIALSLLAITAAKYRGSNTNKVPHSSINTLLFGLMWPGARSPDPSILQGDQQQRHNSAL